MGDLILDIWSSVISLFDAWVWYLTHFPEFYESFIQYLMKWFTYLTFWLFEQAMYTAFTITQEFLASFNYKENVQSAWNSLPDTPRSILAYLRLPECLNIIISAIGTKFTLKFIPFGS